MSFHRFSTVLCYYANYDADEFKFVPLDDNSTRNSLSCLVVFFLSGNPFVLDAYCKAQAISIVITFSPLSYSLCNYDNYDESIYIYM